MSKIEEIYNLLLTADYEDGGTAVYMPEPRAEKQLFALMREHVAEEEYEHATGLVFDIISYYSTGEFVKGFQYGVGIAAECLRPDGQLDVEKRELV